MQPRQRLLGNTVDDKAFVLLFVNDGVELLDHFQKIEKKETDKLPSLLILDLNMPRKNGREALAELIYKPYFKSFTTTIFSTTSNESEKQKCIDLGVMHYFVKPTSYDQLMSIVSVFIGLSKLQK